ncbi:hypothetical protein VTN31DRAFT_4882 [Thermomyces dupontii]|uniref:uncharacterized protein n=1 Tax=Talaromyces thermophilus TaxID=28565 RepID=UPI0037425094
MVLLTSGTVSAIVTSTVVCVSTFLLFLSGYALQQKSLRDIQHALREPIHSSTPSIRSHVYTDGAGDVQQYLADGDNAASTKPTNVAYLQLLTRPNPSNICSAILFYKKLAENSSAVHERLFVYPRDWDMVTFPSDEVNTALSLLRAASSQYGIWLVPIDTSILHSRGYSLTDARLLRLAQIQFMPYDSVLYLRTPGYVLDVERLDQLLFSRPLPLEFDRRRPESYQNEAWIPLPLLPNKNPSLPPAYLITVNPKPDRVEARTHIPNVTIRGFGDLVASPSYKNPAGQGPAYAYFDVSDDGHVRWENNPYYGQWRKEQYEVCDGLDLESIDDW